MTPLRTLLLASASALFACSASFAQDATPLLQDPPARVRVVDRVDENNLVTLRGNTHPFARIQNDRGRVSADLPLSDVVLVLSRSPEQQAAFDAFVESQQDPKSPNYHQWLDPDEVGERFGPAMSDISVIEAWLQSHGLSIGEVSKDRMAIHFSGTASQVEEAFHTELHNLEVNGKAHIANMADPKIPAALAAVVAGPKALHNFQPHPLHHTGSQVKFNRTKGGWERVEPTDVAADKLTQSTPRPQFGINDSNVGLLEDVAPLDFASIYNVAPAWSKNYTGAGQTIAIAGTSDINANDVATFRKDFGLPAVPSFKQVVANGLDPGQCGVNPSQPNYCGMSDQIENSLDVEWSGAVAKGASIVLVVSGEDSAGSIDTVYSSSSYVIKNKTASILNVSYGLCELGEGTAGNLSYKNLWQTAASEGIAVFVASGDSGSAACDQGGDANGVPYAAEYGLSVSGIASTPYNTAVGGTDLFWCDPVKTSDSCKSEASKYWNTSNSSSNANAIGYVPEIPWNSTCANKVAIEYLQSVADQLNQIGYSVSKPTDAESSCSFAADPNVEQDVIAASNGQVDISGFVDTVGGGGGKSNCINGNGQTVASCTTGYPKPSWQAGVTGAGDGRRDIPDVSFFASSGFLGSAYLICVSANGACTYSATSEPVYQEVGGTSVASPAMAGVMALINQKSGYAQGNPNSQLYQLAAKQNYSSCSSESVLASSSCYFNDIDTQSNAQACDHVNNSPNCQDIHSDNVGILQGFNAAKGFDLATGLGSLNVANIVNAWQAEAIPEVTLSATSLTFPSTPKGILSKAQTVTLKSSGHAALNLSGGVKLTGADATSFVLKTNCGSSLAAGASCLIEVQFKPAAAGTLTASVTIGDNVIGSPQTITLTGVGTAQPAVRLSHSSLSFGSLGLGKQSAPRTVTLQNSGTGTLALSKIAIGGTNPLSFIETNNCHSSLLAGKSCIVSVTFKPAKLGALSAYVSITDNATGSPHKIALTGTGSGPIVSLSKSSLTFAATTVGQTAATQNFTLTNKGTAKLGKPGGGAFIGVTGTGASSFSQADTCGNGLNGGASCTITVTFRPRATGSLTAAVTFTDNASPSIQTVKLSGTGK